ncbi:acetyl/propionyl/methylcrotonyl-CoA carboxylase subunit alpha [Actinomadura coerulea]|uniref:acetyl/propionyl/methylcrotonyl-CoA carboxylase subunit alpha n=1 Tax=Actinomadura coerulea TaxID=46159 RepID=UPI00342AFDD2
MINRVLVANRGEIARRVLRACRDLGVGTVAVHSDPDAAAPHVREADVAGRLPGASPAETYLSVERLLDVARRAGADAVHPGYGFLSENADFARAVVDAGLTWIGPPPEAIAAMGLKIEAKKLMAAADVPVLPELDPARVGDADLPLLVKASAGGGGRGMRVVRTPEELRDAVAAARREAESAFGDPTVFCEPLLEDARHIEVQILADAHGTVWTLGERECSIQRRHQKIIEEAPSPAVGPELRARLCGAAASAARAIGYAGAGTVEFMLARDGRFYFLEVNTRLQVEHPVTECVYGVDLVRLQIEVAEGARLPAAPPEPRGHAVEVRLYAEDPAQDWRPAGGTLHTFEVPGADAEFAVPAAYGLRLDSGVESGSEVGVHYDPMLAKVIAWAPSRAAAARRLAAALRGARIHGLTTNRDLLVRILEEPGFLDGATDTGYLDRVGLDALAAPLADEAAVRVAALAAALAQAAASRAGAAVLGGLPSGWRNVRSQPQRRTFQGPGGPVDVDYRLDRNGLTSELCPGTSLLSAAPDRVVLDHGGLRETFTLTAAGDAVHVDSRLGPVTLVAVPRFADPGGRIAPGSLLAPMPGTVVRVDAEPGAEVAEGQTLVVLEAMKMEHRIAAPSAGTVAELNVTAGQQVESGAVLAVIEGTPE